MKFRKRMVVGFALVGVFVAGARDVSADPKMETHISTMTAPPPVTISPGRYVVNVEPAFNKGMDKRLEKALSKVTGLSAVEARASDSTIRFTVNEKSHVRLTELQKVVRDTDNGASITGPVLVGSLTTSPEL